MKSRMILPAFSILLALSFTAGSNKAEAFDVGVSVGGGHHHHYYNGGLVEYHTVDPVYSTWYPDSNSSYIYGYGPTGSSAYYGDGHGYYRNGSGYYDNGYGYSNNRYIYSTNSRDYHGWYGSGRTGHGGNYGGGHVYIRGGDGHRR